jgi:two-component system, NarL family, response regulator
LTIRRKQSGKVPARIIVLTTYDSDEDIYRGLRAGAKGYLLKDAEPDELLVAIRTVHSGKKYIPPDIGAKLAERMSNPQLSDRELEVVRLMVAGNSTQEISAALSIAESTVKFHVNNVLSKLGVSDRTPVFLLALGCTTLKLHLNLKNLTVLNRMKVEE